MGMDVKQIARAIAALIIKVAAAVLVVLFIYRLALSAYTFGFRIFAEKPVSEGEGITVSVAITQEDDVRDIGQKLYDKGLIRSTRLFYFQEMFSNYHGIEKPGVYELSTGMTVEEMLEEISKGMPEGSDWSGYVEPEPEDGDAGAEDADGEGGAAGEDAGGADDNTDDGGGGDAGDGVSLPEEE